MLRNGISHSDLFSCIRKKRCCTAAASHKVYLVLIYLILDGKVVDDRFDLFVSLLKDLARALFNGDTAVISKRLDASSCRFYVAVGISAFFYVAKNVCCAGVCDGDSLAVL